MNEAGRAVLVAAAYFIALFFLITSLDDVVIDFVYYLLARSEAARRVKLADLDSRYPKRIAIFVPAWDEPAVIADMIENTLDLVNYPRSRYDIFTGVYPNDHETRRAFAGVIHKYDNVHEIVNDRPGPTSKADNLNSLYRGMKDFEAGTGRSFEAVVIHDAEDIVHPTSLKLFNFLIPKNAAVQLPVFPLQPPFGARNFIKRLVTGTYADEFAENHLRAMVVRQTTGGFVPSAGTGIAFARGVLDEEAARNEGDVFAINNLTEDYEIALRLRREGKMTTYFIERMERIRPDGRVVTEYIATREYFPDRFWPAVKQKARWIYGITFQTPKLVRWRGRTLAERVSIYRDIKSKYANLVTVPAYALFTYSMYSIAYGLLYGVRPAVYVLFPLGSPVWWVIVVDTAFALERQLMRFVALKEIYGWREAATGVLLPPLLPLRFVWGNVINFAATLRAWRIRIVGTETQKSTWVKTSHASYPPAEVVAEYKRKLGDLLLEKGYITLENLGAALMQQPVHGGRIGELLVDQGFISENDLLVALGELFRTGYIDLHTHLIDPALATEFPEHVARKHTVAPLIKSDSTVLVASPEIINPREIERETGLRVKFVLSPSSHVKRAIELLYQRPRAKAIEKKRLGTFLLQSGNITEEQLIEALRRQAITGERLGQALVELQYLSQSDVQTAIAALLGMKKSA